MSPGHADIEAIFAAALEHPSGPRRDAYLAAACGGGAALRCRVEERIGASPRNGKNCTLSGILIPADG
jgi:hypothetical protein